MNEVATAAVQDLVDQIVAASQAYYYGDAPIMTDQEFDHLVEKLRSIEPRHDVLTMVGWGAKPRGKNKVALPAPIRHSLTKIHRAEQVANWMEDQERYGGSREVSPKMDGMTVVLAYDDKHDLTLACSRGDGVEGVDLTYKMFYIGTKVVKCVPGVIRGELYISYPTFNEHLADEYANPRNAVAGIVNGDDLSLLKYVEFIAHGFEDEHHRDAVSQIVPIVPRAVLAGSWAVMLADKENKILSDFRDKYVGLYPMDGVVLGSGDDAIAFKFPTVEVKARLSHIEWNLSPRGQLFPTAVFTDFVDLYGTKVNRATMHNAAYVRDNMLSTGAVVTITKANEIIPYITGIVEGGTVREDYCPTEWNGVPTKWVGLKLFLDHSPEALMRQSLTAFMKSYFTTDGVKSIANLVEDLKLKSFLDLRDVQPWRVEQALERTPGWGKGKIEKMAALYDWDRKLDGRYFFSSLGLNGIGSSNSFKMVEHIKACVNQTPDYFLSVARVPSNIEEVIREHWSIVSAAYICFHDRFEFPTEDKVEFKFDYNMVFTGKFSVQKSELEALARKKGIEVAGSINGKTGYLVQADPDSMSSKTQKAIQKGISVIGEAEFKVMMSQLEDA